MSEIDQVKVNEIFRVAASERMRKMLKEIGDGALSFGEIADLLIICNQKTGSKNLTFHYLKKGKKWNLIRQDRVTKRWYLTRIGVQFLDIIESFERHCTNYDMKDCDADGKVEIFVTVTGRKKMRLSN